MVSLEIMKLHWKIISTLNSWLNYYIPLMCPYSNYPFIILIPLNHPSLNLHLIHYPHFHNHSWTCTLSNSNLIWARTREYFNYPLYQGFYFCRMSNFYFHWFDNHIYFQKKMILICYYLSLYSHHPLLNRKNQKVDYFALGF